MGLTAPRDPRVVAMLRAFKAALLEREREQMRAMARRWLGVEEALEGSIEALAREVDGLRQEGGVSRSGSSSNWPATGS